MAKVSGKVFISYRETDGGPVVARLIDLLIERYGAGNVLTDIGSIQSHGDSPGDAGGAADAIRNAVRQCVALLVVIGPQWLDTQTPDGQRRLDDPADGVRVAVETAVQHGLVVIPMLVAGGQMPGAFELPPSLQPVARLQALPLRDGPVDFTGDAQYVTAAIDHARATRLAAGNARDGAGQRPWMLRRPLLSAVAILLVLVSLALLLATVAQQQAQSPADRSATATALAARTSGTAAAQATATAAAIAAQTATAAATQTATARIVHFPYFTHAPGPGCDSGNAPWQGAGYMCSGDHTNLATGIVAEPYLDWYRADQPNPFPGAYTLSVHASNIVGVYLVVGMGGSGVGYQVSLQSGGATGSHYAVEQCTSLTISGGANCMTLATASWPTSGAHTLAITRTAGNLTFRVDGNQVRTAADASPDTAVVQVVGAADVSDFSLG